MPSNYQNGAYIDLKNVDFFFRDGYRKLGTVGTGGATLGASVVPVAGFTGVLSTGVRVAFAGQTTEYTIASTTETTGSTTSITVTPPLTAAVVAGDAVTAGPHYLEITVGDGNLTHSEKKAREYKMNRGRLDQVRNGDEAPMDVSFQFAWLYLKSGDSASVPTPQEFLKREGPAAAYVTTGGDCEPFAIDIVYINKPGTCGANAQPNEEVVLPQFRYETLNFDPKAGTVSADGKCNSTVGVYTRKAA